MGEEAVDGGGVKREFFRLLAYEVKLFMCVGKKNCYGLRHDTPGLQVCSHCVRTIHFTYNCFTGQ